MLYQSSVDIIAGQGKVTGSFTVGAINSPASTFSHLPDVHGSAERIFMRLCVINKGTRTLAACKLVSRLPSLLYREREVGFGAGLGLPRQRSCRRLKSDVVGGISRTREIGRDLPFVPKLKSGVPSD
jgi:hypothetical protein